jgi:hypothetical protein
MLRILFLLIFLIPSAQAFVVEVEGEAALNGNINQVRQLALKDAMRQAALRADAHVVSTQMMSQGNIETDDVSLNTEARVRDVEVIWEGAEDGLYKVAIRADVAAGGMCRNLDNNFRKAVAVTGFGLVSPKQATLGRLQNIEQDIARVFINSMNDSGQVHALDASHIGLYSDPAKAPVHQNQQQHLTTSANLAKQLGAQYIVSGVIRGLDTIGDIPDKPSSTERWLSLSGFSDNTAQRQFVMDVYVHDGFSGALIFNNTYATKGEWNLSRMNTSGFASPAFWKSGYGRAVREAMAGAIDDVTMSLRCQPFMAKIIKTEGKRLHIEALAGAGIRPGDKFKVYRTGTFYNLDLEPRTEIKDTDLSAVVKQVQPQFIVADLDYSAQQLAIQRDDIVIAW